MANTGKIAFIFTQKFVIESVHKIMNKISVINFVIQSNKQNINANKRTCKQ